MKEIAFVVDVERDGGYVARAVGHAIFTQADDIRQLRANVLDAVRCHFPKAGDRPRTLRLRHDRP